MLMEGMVRGVCVSVCVCVCVSECVCVGVLFCLVRKWVLLGCIEMNHSE